MIGLLSGVVWSRDPGVVLINVRGIGLGSVGYVVNVPKSISSLDFHHVVELTLHVETIVKESSIELYGFRSELERKTFSALVGVKGVGPKTALTIINDVPVRDIATAVRTKNVSKFTAVSGIGKKTAENIVKLELSL